MGTKHTPGPWAYSESPGKTWSDHGMRAVANVGKFLVWISSERVKELHNKSEANAKLIAAAPDLLIALTDMINSVLDDTGFAEHHKVVALRNAKATIKKATE